MSERAGVSQPELITNPPNPRPKLNTRHNLPKPNPQPNLSTLPNPLKPDPQPKSPIVKPRIPFVRVSEESGDSRSSGISGIHFSIFLYAIFVSVIALIVYGFMSFYSTFQVCKEREIR